MFGERILILVPHPDDEVVGCCAAIGRARADGATVHGLYLTTGVPTADALWSWDRRHHPDMVARRREEAQSVADTLGIDVVSFSDVATRQLKANLKEAREALIEALDGLEIDMVWVPAYEGGHQDHDVANYLGHTVDPRVEVWEFAEYNNAGHRVHSQRFAKPNGSEREILLTAEEQAAKRAALGAYASEARNLGYVQVERECFRPLAAYDYSRPPHAGLLFYQRFQWVPFRHPRIDFTKPEEVSVAIAGFAAKPAP